MLIEELRQILAKVTEGDEEAFRLLFDTYRPNIYTTALRITSDEWIAEDIVQDTFIKVWIKRTELLSIANFEGWLYTVARNVTLNLLKKDEHYKAYSQEEAKDALLRFYPEADYDLQDKEFKAVLKKAIDRLPPKQQLTYKLIKEEFLKRDQVALELNVSPETVKWNLEQAMKSIRAYCSNQLKDLPMVVVLYLFSKYF